MSVSSSACLVSLGLECGAVVLLLFLPHTKGEETKHQSSCSASWAMFRGRGLLYNPETVLLLLLRFLIMCRCVCLSDCLVYVSVQVPKNSEVMYLHGFLSHLAWMWETKLWSSVRAVCALTLSHRRWFLSPFYGGRSCSLDVGDLPKVLIRNDS